jgi:RNA polymerase sigma-70 factor, ECF subfamily
MYFYSRDEKTMPPVQQQEAVAEYTTYADSASRIIPSMRDGDLVKQAQTGNQTAFETLVERYHIPLHRFIARYFVDYDQRCDVLQQVLIQLYLSLPDLRTDGTVQAWLFRVARNRCVDELRHRHVPNFSSLAIEESDEEGSLSESALVLSRSVEELAEHHELQQNLYQAISDLPQRYREIVWLRYSTRLTFGEIGRILCIPEATARTYFQRAKLLLRQSLRQVLD